MGACEHVPAETLAELPVGDVMSTDLVTVTGEDSVMMAWELMRRAGYHHIPVVNGDGYLLGVLEFGRLAADWEAGGPERARRPVIEHLRGRRFSRVTPIDPVAHAAHVMLDDGLDYVAVTGADGRLVGLVTARDLVGLLAGRPARPERDGPRGGEPVVPDGAHAARVD